MSVNSLSQNQRVLRLAYARADQGIDATDFLLPNVVDGGKPITRLAARIKDLEDDGIHFSDGGRRNKVKVYILDRASVADATKPPEPPSACHALSQGGSGSTLPTTSGPSQAAPLSPSSTAAGDGTGALFDIGRAQQSAVYDPDWSDAA